MTGPENNVPTIGRYAVSKCVRDLILFTAVDFDAVCFTRFSWLGVKDQPIAGYPGESAYAIESIKSVRDLLGRPIIANPKHPKVGTRILPNGKK